MEDFNANAFGSDYISPDSYTPKKKNFFWRPGGLWTDFFIVAAILSLMLIFVGSPLADLLTKKLFPAAKWLTTITGDEDISTFMLSYFGFFGIWIIFMIVISFFRSNRPIWKAFLYNGHGNNIKAIFIGILIGFGMNGICILISWIMGDISLSFNEFNPKLFFMFLFCVLIQSGGEEIVTRCYLYQKLRRRYRWPIIAIVVNALFFTALHINNDGVTKLGLIQILEAGILFSLFIYFYDSLWTAIWAHTAWNFTQSIVFGLPNSGIVSKYSVFRLDAASARNGIFYNVGFGVEGSLGSCIILGIAILAVLIINLIKRRGERKDHWEEMDEYTVRNPLHIWLPIVISLALGVAAYMIYPAAKSKSNDLKQKFEALPKELTTGETAENTTEKDNSTAESARPSDESAANADKAKDKTNSSATKTTNKTDSNADKTTNKAESNADKSTNKTDANA
ncbi:MAG: CPBP family glutamic-type intramembrane protease [Lachnospiraceae bacterium]|nr:CPBP family glutamic-type intramembrane protease [Lachnospiraceae bacterium]